MDDEKICKLQLFDGPVTEISEIVIEGIPLRQGARVMDDYENGTVYVLLPPDKEFIINWDRPIDAGVSD
jgi:hypothetical protein